MRAKLLGCAVSYGQSQMFRQAANETRAQVKHDGFDLSCIEIRKEDLRKVYDYLSINDS